MPLHGFRVIDLGCHQAGQFGRQGVVELRLIMGNYSLRALLINSFDMDSPGLDRPPCCLSRSMRALGRRASTLPPPRWRQGRARGWRRL
jgi:hypothetical protein